MRTVLIVANKTIGGRELSTAVAERVDEGEVSFHLLVPVPPPRPLVVAVGPFDAGTIEYVEIPDQLAAADQRLAEGLEWLRNLGVSATGEVGTNGAVASVVAVVARGGIDEVLVSTLPSRLSRWLKQDLPCKLGKALEIPVCVVTAVPSSVATTD